MRLIRGCSQSPEYEKKILDALAKNKAVDFGGNIPVVAYTHIDDTYEKCYGYTQGMKENVGYSGHSSTKGTDAGRQKKAMAEGTAGRIFGKAGQQAKKQQLEMLNKKLQRWNWKEVDRLSHGTVRGRWQRLPMLMMQIL